MAWTKSTLLEHISRIENDFSTKFFGTAAALRRSVLKIIARVFAGSSYLLHLYLAWIFDQAFAYLADADQLLRHGQEIGIYRKPATFASGLVVFTGAAGLSIPQGTLVQYASDQTEYQTTADVTVGTSGTVSVTVTALVEGTAGNRDDGVELDLVSTLDSTATVVVSGGLTGGADVEDWEEYRARILFKKRNPPQGGADADYVIWATSVAPVTDAWVFPNYPEANSVSVRVADYDRDVPTLTADEVADVLAYLTDRTRKPLTADVRVLSVIPVYVQITAQIRPNTAAAKAAAIVELKDYFRSEGVPNTTLIRSQIQNAMAGGTGVTGLVISQIAQSGELVENVTLNMNQVPVLSGTTFTAIE